MVKTSVSKVIRCLIEGSAGQKLAAVAAAVVQGLYCPEAEHLVQPGCKETWVALRCTSWLHCSHPRMNTDSNFNCEFNGLKEITDLTCTRNERMQASQVLQGTAASASLAGSSSTAAACHPAYVQYENKEKLEHKCNIPFPRS